MTRHLLLVAMGIAGCGVEPAASSERIAIEGFVDAVGTAPLCGRATFHTTVRYSWKPSYRALLDQPPTFEVEVPCIEQLRAAGLAFVRGDTHRLTLDPDALTAIDVTWNARTWSLDPAKPAAPADTVRNIIQREREHGAAGSTGTRAR